MRREIISGHCADSQTRLVISRDFTAQLTGLYIGVTRSRNTLTRFQSICKADGACALLFTKKIDNRLTHITENICKIGVVLDYTEKILVKERHATEVIKVYFQIKSWYFSETYT